MASTQRTPSVAPSGGPSVASSRSGGSAPSIMSGSFLYRGFQFIILMMVVSVIAVIAIMGSTQDSTLNTRDSRLYMDVTSVVFVLVAIASLTYSGRNIKSAWGRIGFLFLIGTLIPLSISLSVFTMGNLNSPMATLGTIVGAFVLTIIYAMIYYGSTGQDTLRTYIFYGASVLLLLYILFFMIVFGNPIGVSTTIPDEQITTTTSDKYTLIYNSDDKLQGVFKRRLFDQVYLSIAYPTLSSSETPPLHNSGEVQGAHYLSEYGKHLKSGASAFLFDIFYEFNASSPNVNTWRVGTLNTRDGTVQNRRTISLASVLNATNRAIENNNDTRRLIYLVLNPRYTTGQRESIPDLENSLANLIQEYITYSTLPNLGMMLSENTRIEDQYLGNAKQQVVIFLGGTRRASSLSSKLKNTIHGVVNLTDCYVRTEGAQGYNSIAYDSQDNSQQRRLDLGTGSFAGTNENRIQEFVRNDSRQSVQTSFVATFPNNANNDIAYTNDVPVYISHSVSFPFVYPRMLSMYSKHQNMVFYQGYAPIVSPMKIISLIFSNEDGENKPARQRMNQSLRCTEEYENTRVLNPAMDSEWPDIILEDSSKPQLTRANWCNNYVNNQDNRTSVNINNPQIFPLVLYYPEPDVNYSGGMIPKPTLVQTKDGTVYQLRKVIQSQTVVPESTES
jgi:hypothetical protein